MKKAPLCPYHQTIFNRRFGRNPSTRLPKSELRARAWNINRQCLACQCVDNPAPIPRDTEVKP